MSWWVLVLGWLLLLLLALGMVALVGLRTFRRARALLSEVGAATDRLTAAAEARASAAEARRPPSPDGPGRSPGRTP